MSTFGTLLNECEKYIDNDEAVKINQSEEQRRKSFLELTTPKTPPYPAKIYLGGSNVKKEERRK